MTLGQLDRPNVTFVQTGRGELEVGAEPKGANVTLRQNGNRANLPSEQNPARREM